MSEDGCDSGVTTPDVAAGGISESVEEMVRLARDRSVIHEPPVNWLATDCSRACRHREGTSQVYCNKYSARQVPIMDANVPNEPMAR